MPKSVHATGCVLAAGLLLSSTAMAQQAGMTEERGPYLNLGGGANSLEGFSATGVNGRTAQLNENPGPIGIVDLGYMLPYQFRGEITASGVGESQLAVPTAQGVNEPRNRRVVIMEGGPGS